MARPSKVTPEDILTALGAHPGSTASELAETLGIGQSTAAKHLAVLETTGAACRALGGREAGRRVPDRWSLTTSTVPTRTPGPAPAPIPAPAAAAEEEDKAPAATAGGGRLARGELGSLVYQFVAARPDEDLGPTAIGKALGRSSGAVSNALSRLEASGQVRLVADKPLRYRAATP
jgi:DNA-binding MarR family transcriptional regulator